MRLSRLLRTTAAAIATVAGISAVSGASADAQLAEDTDAQIVGGTNAPTGAHPFMASLQDMTRDAATPRDRHRCGGSLVAPHVVLTAAHCVYNATRSGPSRPEDFDVIVGRTRLNDPTQGVVRNVAAIAVHPEYDGDWTRGADVALLRLDASTGIIPVRLPASVESSRFAPGAMNTLTGWGRDASGTVPDFLQQIDLPIQTDEFMASRYGADYIPAEMIGAGNGTGFGQCKGDSGGPLFFRSNSQVVQVGVVSFSNKPDGCASEPGVLARVAEGPLRTWISTMLTTPSIRITDTSTPEGYRSNDPITCGGRTFCSFPGQAFFRVSLSGPTINTVSFRVATANGTATAPADYTAKTLSLTFQPGATSVEYYVPIVRDNASEPNEHFFVNLSSVVGATVADAQGQATIVNGYESLDS